MAKLSFKQKLLSIFKSKSLDESFYEDLEDTLLEGDFGAKKTLEISDFLRSENPKTKEELIDLIKNYMRQNIKQISFEIPKDELTVFMVLGVNGVGKTTSIAKLANYYKNKGLKTLLSASDTFRAAAIDQLEMHANKLDVRIIKQDNGSDPGAVIYDAISSALAHSENLILCDTAGRMHNKEDLVRELQKIDKIVKSRIKPENYKKILVLDSTTGQNAVSQATIFNEAVGLDAIFLTKCDSESKAGALLQIPIPVAFIGFGEKYTDIQEFDKEKFIDSLISL